MMRIATTLLVALLAVGGCSPMTDEDQPQEIASADSLAVMYENLEGGAANDSTWRLPSPEFGYNAREGRALFSHYCAVCHGAEGRGDGFNAFNLDPRPRNLADPEFQMSRSDDDLYEVIRSGGSVAGLSSAMPPWGRTVSERGIENIVTFLRTLPDTLQSDQ